MIVLNKPTGESNVDASYWMPDGDAAKKLEVELAEQAAAAAPAWTRSAKVTVFLLSALLVVLSIVCGAAIYLATYYGSALVAKAVDISSDNESVYMYYQNDTYDFLGKLRDFLNLKAGKKTTESSLIKDVEFRRSRRY